jgi:hypothetical protein
VRRGPGLVDALSLTIARPSTWPLALGAFLLRGGIVLVLVPIVALPTPVGIGNLLAPALTSISLGTIPVGLVVASVGLGVGFAIWVVVGGWLAAALEAEGIGIVAAAASRSGPSSGQPRTGEPEPSAHRRHRAARILAARLACLAPLAVALAIGSVRIVFVTYTELVLPSDATSPIVIRVLRDAPDVPIVIALTWMAGEIVAAVAARRIVLAGDGVGLALRSAVVRTLRHPIPALVRFWVPLLASVALLIPTGFLVATAWHAAGDALAGSHDPVGLLVALLAVDALVAFWLVGLLVIGVLTAWRAAVWTVAEAAAAGTFGGSTNRRPGDWRVDPRSATL